MKLLHEIEEMFFMMNPTGQANLHGMAKQFLRSFPATGGLLRPVQQADDVKLLNDQTNCAIYNFPLVGARKPVDRKEAGLG